MEMLEDVFVIDLSGCWFLAARVIAQMETGDFIPRHIDIRDKVTFGDLLMTEGNLIPNIDMAAES